MNNWMDDFIDHCLKDVPHGRYRKRAEAELRDHMETQRPFSSEQEVLQTMGDPEQLRREYRAAWKRSPEGRGNIIAGGCLWIWAMMFIICGLLEWLNERFYISGTWISPACLFLIPFALGGAFLRVCFWEERRRVRWVTLGLLAEWAWVSASYVGWYALLASEPRSHTEWNTRLVISCLLVSFAACLALGLVFGWKRERRSELA